MCVCGGGGGEWRGCHLQQGSRSVSSNIRPISHSHKELRELELEIGPTSGSRDQVQLGEPPPKVAILVHLFPRAKP